MNDRLSILVGDAMVSLDTLPEKSVQMCCTSPPYWGLRDYGVEPSIWDLPPLPCDHKWRTHVEPSANGQTTIGRDGP